jgi:hypothetical protein
VNVKNKLDELEPVRKRSLPNPEVPCHAAQNFVDAFFSKQRKQRDDRRHSPIAENAQRAGSRRDG